MASAKQNYINIITRQMDINWVLGITEKDLEKLTIKQLNQFCIEMIDRKVKVDWDNETLNKLGLT